MNYRETLMNAPILSKPFALAGVRQETINPWELRFWGKDITVNLRFLCGGKEAKDE
jgi:hypothetical protein